MIGAAAAAWYFRAEIAAAIGHPASATTDPAITAAAAAAALQQAKGATPAQQATAAQQAATAQATAPLILPTIQSDNPTVHDALCALAAAENADELTRARNRWGVQDSTYLLTVSQWNWYRNTQALGGTIEQNTSYGSNAIPASVFFQLRQSLNLLKPRVAPAAVIPAGFAQGRGQH